MKNVYTPFGRTGAKRPTIRTGGALETLLKAAAREADPGIRIIHEPKRVRGAGAPDFMVKKAAMILGYVEDKRIGENLGQVPEGSRSTRSTM